MSRPPGLGILIYRPVKLQFVSRLPFFKEAM